MSTALGKSAKLHSGAPSTKISLRRWAVESLAGVPARVIETHAGVGLMRGSCYADAAEWIGFDVDKKMQGVIHCDSRLALRSMDLESYSVLDVDAFGCPYQHIYTALTRGFGAHHSRFCVVATNGEFGGANSVSQLKRNLIELGWTTQILDATGFQRDTPPRRIAAQAVPIFKRCIEAWSGRKVIGLRSALSNNGCVLYYAAVVE